MRYILWVVLLLEDCDVANDGLHLGFNHALEIRLNSRYNFTLVLTRGGGGRAYMVVATPRPAPHEVPCECEFSMFILHLQ